MTVPWIHSTHVSSPFGKIETAISVGDFDQVKNLLEEVRICLNPKSEAYFWLIAFKNTLEAFYDVSLSKPIEIKPDLCKISLNQPFTFFNFKERTLLLL